MFIVTYVALVLLTGARDVVDWVGLVVFLVSLVVIAGAWFAATARACPFARIFGKVGR